MKLYAGGNLDFYLPGRKSILNVDLPEPAFLSDVLSRLGVPLAEIYLVVVNGELVELQGVLVRRGDDVKIYPAVNGG